MDDRKGVISGIKIPADVLKWSWEGIACAAVQLASAIRSLSMNQRDRHYRMQAHDSCQVPS